MNSRLIPEKWKKKMLKVDFCLMDNLFSKYKLKDFIVECLCLIILRKKLFNRILEFFRIKKYTFFWIRNVSPVMSSFMIFGGKKESTYLLTLIFLSIYS